MPYLLACQTGRSVLIHISIVLAKFNAELESACLLGGHELQVMLMEKLALKHYKYQQYNSLALVEVMVAAYISN